MVHLEKLNQISYNSDGEALAWYDLSVSTAAELPALNSVVFGAKIQAPSRAQIIQADEPTIVTLDEDGNWYPEQSDSGAAATPERSTRGLTKTAQPTGISNILLDIEPQISEYVEEKEPVEVKDGGEHR